MKTITLDFEQFIKTGKIFIPYGMKVAEVLDVLRDETFEYQEFNQATGAHGIIYQQAELLFWEHRFFTIQFEIDRFDQLLLNGQEITGATTMNQLSKMLEASQISYQQMQEHGQKVLETASHVRLYFDAEAELFRSAINSWDMGH